MTDPIISQFQNELGACALFSLVIGLLKYSINIVRIDYGRYYMTFCVSDNLTPKIVKTEISTEKLQQNNIVILYV